MKDEVPWFLVNLTRLVKRHEVTNHISVSLKNYIYIFMLIRNIFSFSFKTRNMLNKLESFACIRAVSLCSYEELLL